MLVVVFLISAWSERAYGECSGACEDAVENSNFLQVENAATPRTKSEQITCLFEPGLADEHIGDVSASDDGKQTNYCVSLTGTTYSLLDSTITDGLEPGMQVTLKVEESIHPHTFKVLDLVDVVKDVALDVSAVGSSKQMKILMILCKFTDVPDLGYMDETKAMNELYQTPSEVPEGQFRGSFADMLINATYGKISAPRSEGLVVTIDMETQWSTFGDGSCPYGALRDLARQKIAEQRPDIDLSQFTNKEYFQPQSPNRGCGWGGLAAVGCSHYTRLPNSDCDAWYRIGNRFVRAHELGHNLGLLHAGGQRGSSYVEYGDRQASMGASYRFSSFNAAARYQMGVLEVRSGEVAEIEESTTTPIGLQTLSLPPGVPGADYIAIRMSCPECIPKVSSHARNVGGHIWIQFRGDEGYSNVHGGISSDYQNRVFVHLARRYTSPLYGEGTELWASLSAGEEYSVPNTHAIVRVADIPNDGSYTGDVAFVEVLIATTTTTTRLGNGPYFTATGDCTIDSEGCATSKNWPANYGNRENCELRGVRSVGKGIVVRSFNTESRWDKLWVNGQAYSGTTPPADGTVLNQDITWRSDHSIAKSGWKICFQSDDPPTETTTWSPTTASTHSFCVVAQGTVVGAYCNVEEARLELNRNARGSRMICEVKNGRVLPDPHTVGGRPQNPQNGFNKYWNDWHDINRMRDVCARITPCTRPACSANSSTSSFCVVSQNRMIGAYCDVESARRNLNSHARGSRMICEVKDGRVLGDPHTVSGHNQVPDNGFNKYWNNWHDINSMAAVCKRSTTCTQLNC